MIAETSIALGALGSLGGALWGAISSSNATKKRNALINQQREDAKRWYQQQVSQDPLSRSYALATLKKQKELLDQQYKSSAARNVVIGGTDEALALQQAQANASLDNVTTSIAGQASANREAAEQQYRQNEMALAQQESANLQNQANNIASAAGQVVNSGLGLIGQGIKAKV